MNTVNNETKHKKRRASAHSRGDPSMSNDSPMHTNGVIGAEPLLATPKKNRRKKSVIFDDVENVPAGKPTKSVVKRVPSKYNEFIKHHMALESVKALQPKERFGYISKLWRENKATKD
jgi:hypothetical protein